MIYKFLLMFATISPALGILALIGFYILVKKHGDEPTGRSTEVAHAEDEMVFGNPHAMNNDNFDLVNGPNAPHFR